MTRVRVIGAGLSGLAVAWYLADAGVPVEIVEAADRPGGLIQTESTPHGLIESAARAFTASDRVDALFAAAGVERCSTLDASRRRYIFRHGRPRRWPLGPIESAGAAARAASAWVRRDLRPHGAESVAAWGRRVLGPAATAWLLGPALQGIYATPPDQLAAGAIFGPGRRPGGGGSLVAPRHGMGELIDHLHARLRDRGAAFAFGTTIDRLEPGAPAVVCTNAPSAARLLALHAPALASTLSRIHLVSLIATTAFFAPHANDARGFGVLFPRQTGVEALGVLFNTDMFPDRGTLRSETWIYSAAPGAAPGAAPPAAEDVAARVAADRAVLTGRKDAPIASHVTWHRDAIPVYDAAVLGAQAALPSLPPWLGVAGNYLGRLGVSKLVDGAAEAAARMAGIARAGA